MENKQDNDNSVEILDIKEIEALLTDSEIDIQEPQDSELLRNVEKAEEEEEKKIDYIPINVSVVGDFRQYDKHRNVIYEQDYDDKFTTRIETQQEQINMRERIFEVFSAEFEKYHENDGNKVDFKVKIKVNKTNVESGHYVEGSYTLGFDKFTTVGVMFFDEYTFADLERNEEENTVMNYVVAKERHLLHISKKIDYLIANTIHIFSMIPQGL